MKRKVNIILLFVFLCLILAGCDITKLDGLKVVSYIDSDMETSGELYKSEFVTDSYNNDVKRYSYTGKGKNSIFNSAFSDSNFYLTDISKYDGIFLIVGNPLDTVSPKVSLMIFDSDDISNYSTVRTGLMDFAGNIVSESSENYINIPSGFYGLMYCNFDDFEFGEQMSENKSFLFGFSIKSPAEGESEHIDIYTSFMYRSSPKTETSISFENTGISYGAVKTLQNFEDAVSSDFIYQTHSAHIFISDFDGGVINGSKSLLIINSSNNNDTRLSEYNDGDQMPVLSGASLSDLNFRMNMSDPQGMYFLISVPDNYSERGLKDPEINIVLTLISNGERIELPSSSMSFYDINGDKKISQALSGVNILTGENGLVYASFDECEFTNGWDWENVSVEIKVMGVKYGMSGHTAYNNRDILFDDFTAVYDENIPAFLRLYEYGSLTAETGKDFGEISVIVTNAKGLPVEGIEVTFEVPENGASATADSYKSVTSAAGIASVNLKANDKTGGYDLIMRAGDLVDSVQLHNVNAAEHESDINQDSDDTNAPLKYIIAAVAAAVLVAGILLISKYRVKSSK